MTPRVVDLPRVRRALDALDALVRRYPRLRGARARVRLGLALDEQKGVDDRGGNRHGDEEEDRDG